MGDRNWLIYLTLANVKIRMDCTAYKKNTRLEPSIFARKFLSRITTSAPQLTYRILRRLDSLPQKQRHTAKRY